jgi:hypothetical protein
MRGESSEHADGTAAPEAAWSNVEDSQPSDAVSRARLQGKRAALSLVIVVAVLFIGASAAQIIPAVFGWQIRPLPPAPVGTSTRTCADGIRALADAIDRTGGAFAEWDAAAYIARACAASSEGLDAWAALMRLRYARLQLPHRFDHEEPEGCSDRIGDHVPAKPETCRQDHDAELAALRRNVDAHIAAELR